MDWHLDYEEYRNSMLKIKDFVPSENFISGDIYLNDINSNYADKESKKFLFQEAGIIERHYFKEGKSRYEPLTEEHHDHLIDINSGEIVEFVDKEIEELQKKVAQRLGYKLVDHKLELYAQKIKKN